MFANLKLSTALALVAVSIRDLILIFTSPATAEEKEEPPTTRISSQVLFPVFLVGIYASIKIYDFFIYPFFRSPLRHLPGPKNNHPLLGQELHKFLSPTPTSLYLAWSRQWPDAPFIRHLSVGNSEKLLVNSLAAHREVLQTKCYSFVKPAFFTRLVGEIVGKGLLFAEGEEHRRERRLLSGPFSLANLKKLLPIFQAEAQNLSTDITNILSSSDSGAVVEVSAPLSKATLRIIGVTALGAELGDPKLSTFFHECYHRIFEQDLLGNAIMAINAFVPVRWLLGRVEANRRFVGANRDIRELIRGVIRERIAEIEGRKGEGEGVKGERKDLLTYMIEQGNVEGEAWTEEEILGHLLNFVAAGHETTALATVWAIYVLATRQDIQTRLRSEITQLLDQTPTAPGYTEIESLHYLHNFCREVLRVYSPTVDIPREASEDVLIAGVLIPKGTAISICPQVMHSQGSIWGDDAGVFDPDRWDRLVGEQASPYALESFINGPRICIGRAFAMLEFKVLLVEVVGKWRVGGLVNEGEGEVEVLNPSITLRPRGGLEVFMERVGE
ncbi:hypothetical protein FQN50_002833 [Emmonsiellopsis sp. PD_5]|nr:hypothetical protein FQN50_002833 [Emmonsiellopsis sp. PD_5]